MEGTADRRSTMDQVARDQVARDQVAKDQVANERVDETTAGTSAAPQTPELDDEERAERLGQLRDLVELMRPSVQADGGDLVLVSADVEAGVVEVQLQGACSSCAVSSATLQGGVERILTDRLPWVREVVGGLDESMDPYESASLGQGGYVPSF
jgi:Fe-S cluster biogenesis protein NfuA